MGGEIHLHRKVGVVLVSFPLFLFFLLFIRIKEWERGLLLGEVLLLMAPSVATLPLHNRRQGGLTATALWASGGLCEPRVGA